MCDFEDNFLEEKDECTPPLDINQIRATLTQNGYSFLRPVGKGGFSSVFLVFSNQYSLEFVVKVSNFKIPSKNQAQGSEEFDLAEINQLINLNHPNIISIYKYFTDDKYLYIVLEYCQGGSLKDIIQQSGRIRSANLYNYCRQIITALKHCHDLRIAHNDIKPANVLIDKNQRLKLADFGLSKGFSPQLYNANISSMQNNKDHIIGKNGEILIKRFGGSRPYMAPELLNYMIYDPFKADIWALGVTFYEMATGHLPWKTTDFKAMHLQISTGIFSFNNVKLPPAFCQVIHKMLSVNPAKRPTIDWILEQPIFNKGTTSTTKMRSSVINRSSSIGSISSILKRSNERARSSLISFSSDHELKPSDSLSSENEKNQSDAVNNNENDQVPFSLLKPEDEQISEPKYKNDIYAAGEELIAVRRKKPRRNVKLLSSSMPPTKTFY